MRLARRLMVSRKVVAVTYVLMGVASSLTISETKVCRPHACVRIPTRRSASMRANFPSTISNKNVEKLELSFVTRAPPCQPLDLLLYSPYMFDLT